MSFAQLNPSSLKQPVKSYSNGILVPMGPVNMLFVTGQVAQDLDGKVVNPDDAAAQTEFIFGRIADILAEGGMTLDDVVKAQIFVTRMEDSPNVSKIRDVAFQNSKPVSTLVEVNQLVKPGCCVEIEVIAVRTVE
jgi:2-iminobutanoate/2-iminopropanoate deaminase